MYFMQRLYFSQLLLGAMRAILKLTHFQCPLMNIESKESFGK